MSERNEAIRRIKAALKRRSGKVWSVTGDRGSAYSWLKVDVPPAQRTWHFVDNGRRDQFGCTAYDEVDRPGREFGHMSPAARMELALLFGLDTAAHHQGLSISPENRDFYLERAEAGAELPGECLRCGGTGRAVEGDGPDRFSYPCPDCQGDES